MNFAGTIYKVTRISDGKSGIACFFSFSSKTKKDLVYRFDRGLKISDFTFIEIFTFFDKKDRFDLISLFSQMYNTAAPNGYNNRIGEPDPKCTVCGTKKTYKWFNKRTLCSVCHRRNQRENNPILYKKYLEQKRKYKEKYPEKVSKQKKEARLKRLDQYKQRAVDRYWADPVKSRQEKRESHRRHPETHRIGSYIRKKRLRMAMPKCLSKECKNQIKEFYKNRPIGYHVDHIVPIKGNNVSGLHVPWNLQYLTAQENFKKHNKVIL